MALSYRSLWLSDVHLGTRASRAPELLDFLSEVQAEKIYLVGDIVDLERMKSKPMFPDTHMRVVAELARLAASGTEVIFIPGNHDHEFRSLVGRDVMGMPVMLEAEHVMPSGERLLVHHGDVLDGRIRKGTNLEKFAAAGYFLLTEADNIINAWRRRMGHDYYSVSAAIKRKLAGAREFIRLFEQVAAEHARERGFDGVVCGHIHKPNVRRIDGTLYCNDGDWVEHGTALAETADGDLQLLSWQSRSIRIEVIEMTALLAA